MDWGSLAGLAVALAGILIGQLLEGGQLSSLLQPAAFFIVILGTLGAVLLQSGASNFIRGIKMARWVFAPSVDNYASIMNDVGKWSATARREGLLSLERYLVDVRDPFVQKGLRLIIDGMDPFKLREILDIDISAHEVRQRLAARVWESAGGYAPTVGILGAVLGLIHVMENLTEPNRLGSGIAVAFVATIYGVGLANLVFLPIGNKLKAMVNLEIAKREMLATAFAGIASGDNPRLIEERMAVYL
ncbi:MAG TPA: flagellar motor protein [Burkholderiaceae bacterium]|nr:flagellar motor protein [Burkholderiaceae bacterium]